jgi:hypothetical protein
MRRQKVDVVDSDSEHEDMEQHNNKHEAKHPGEHHDRHSRVRHKHKEIDTDGRGKRSVNIFKRDPEKGLKAYHLHQVVDKASGDIYKSWHYGSATHVDDPSYAYNNLKKYPVIEGSDYTPPPLMKENEPQLFHAAPAHESMDFEPTTPYRKLEDPMPSAPPSSNPSYWSSPSKVYPTMWSAQQNASSQSAPTPDKKEAETTCCCFRF